MGFVKHVAKAVLRYFVKWKKNINEELFSRELSRRTFVKKQFLRNASAQIGYCCTTFLSIKFFKTLLLQQKLGKTVTPVVSGFCIFNQKFIA